MLAVALTVTGFALAAEAIRPSVAATRVVRRAWFLADLARLDATLTRAAARVDGATDTDWATGPGFVSAGIVDGSAEYELRISWSESGVSVRVDGQEHCFDRVGIDSIEHAINPVPLLHVKAFDPHRRDGEHWHLIAPFGRWRVP